MYCRNCGASIRNKDLFCRSCGEDVNIQPIMPLQVKYLYFPLVIPGETILSFIATKASDAVYIKADIISLI